MVGPGNPSGGGGRSRRRRGRRPPNRGGPAGRDRQQHGGIYTAPMDHDYRSNQGGNNGPRPGRGGRPGFAPSYSPADPEPLPLIPKLKTKLKKGTSIIGFLSHVQGDLKQKAHEVGCDMVLPRSAFSQNLPQLLRRHGAAEEPEGTVQ